MNEPTRLLYHSTTRLIISKCSLLPARSHYLCSSFFPERGGKLLSQHLAVTNKDIHHSISLVEVWRWDLERFRSYWTYNSFGGRGGGRAPKWRPGNADVRAYRWHVQRKRVLSSDQIHDVSFKVLVELHKLVGIVSWIIIIIIIIIINHSWERWQAPS